LKSFVSEKSSTEGTTTIIDIMHLCNIHLTAQYYAL